MAGKDAGADAQQRCARRRGRCQTPPGATECDGICGGELRCRSWIRLQRTPVHDRHRGGAHDPRRRVARARQRDREHDRGPAPSGEIKPELMESVLEISTVAVREHRPRRGSSCAPCGGRSRRPPRPRASRSAPPARIRSRCGRTSGSWAQVALPRARLGARVRRAPGADLRPARARRHRRPRQGDLRRQRDARPRAGAARLSANSPFWRADSTGLASTRIPIFSAFPRDGHPAHLRQLGGLRRADRVHGQGARDRGLHVPVARRASASRASARSRSA